MQITITLEDDGSLRVGPLDELADAPPFFARQFVLEAIDALTALESAIEGDNVQ